MAGPNVDLCRELCRQGFIGPFSIECGTFSTKLSSRRLSPGRDRHGEARGQPPDPPSPVNRAFCLTGPSTALQFCAEEMRSFLPRIVTALVFLAHRRREFLATRNWLVVWILSDAIARNPSMRFSEAASSTLAGARELLG